MIDSSCRVAKVLMTKDLEVINKCETAEFSSENPVAPKTVFLNVVSNLITANTVEFYADDSGEVDYLTCTTILHTNESPYRGSLRLSRREGRALLHRQVRRSRRAGRLPAAALRDQQLEPLALRKRRPAGHVPPPPRSDRPDLPRSLSRLRLEPRLGRVGFLGSPGSARWSTASLAPKSS